MTNHFTFFSSYYDSVENLDAQTKGEFFDILFKYALRDELPKNDCSPVAMALFMMAKPNLDKSKAKRENGRVGGKQTGSKPEANVKQNESKPKQTSSDKEKEIGVRSKETGEGDYICSDAKAKRFTFSLSKNFSYQSLTEEYKTKLRAYAITKDYGRQLESFIDHHAAKGSGFKDWSRAYNTWIRNQIEFKKSAPVDVQIDEVEGIKCVLLENEAVKIDTLEIVKITRLHEPEVHDNYGYLSTPVNSHQPVNVMGMLSDVATSKRF